MGRCLQQIAKLHASLVQLRLRIANRTSQDFGNLVVFVPLHIVEHEGLSVTRRQLPNGAV
jgi:hypothetical protein